MPDWKPREFMAGYPLLIVVALFAIAITGSVTFVWEQKRKASWQRALNWTPTLATQTFALAADELSEPVLVRNRCFRYRAYPPDANITVYARSRSDEPFERVSRCQDTAEHCRWIKFSIDRPGHVFLDTDGVFFWRHRQRLSCETILAGWPLHQRSSEFQAEQARIRREAEEAARIRRAERQSLEGAFATLVSTLDRGERETATPARDCVASQSRSALGGALDANSLSRWRHDGQVTYQANEDNVLLEVLHFDAYDQSCQQTLNRLMAAGLVNEKVYADALVEEVATLPRGAPPAQNARREPAADSTQAVMRASLERTFTMYDIRLNRGERADVEMRECYMTKLISGERWFQAEHSTRRLMRYTAPEASYNLNVLTFDKQLGSCTAAFDLLREVGLIPPGQFDGWVPVEWGR